MRRNLVNELIRNDIFLITAQKSSNFLMDLLQIESSGLKHAICALISVVASTQKGVEYLIQADVAIPTEVVHTLFKQEDRSVTQRFCIAILQKCSIKDTVIPTYVDSGMINWVINLINKSLNTKIHVFCLDFASAMLANVIHTPSTIEYLEYNPDIATKVMDSLLRLIRETIPVSVLMHL